MSAEERTYLELSEEGEGSHKFYEVVVNGKDVTIRYGRIGDAGQSSKKTYASAEEARKDAEKKINEKKKKGYAPAVEGERKKRPVTRRSVASRPSSAKRAPVLWKFDSGSTAAFGIYIDDARCWVGNQGGFVFALDHEARVQMQFKLPEGVKCLVGDDIWIYAGCDDGNVYDLTGQIARLAYAIADDVDLLWLDIHDGFLAVSDNSGGVTLIGPEEETLWAKRGRGGYGWMVRCDHRAVYHGHGVGVDAFARATGKALWSQKKAGGVLFGWQTAGHVYPGTSSGKVHRLAKGKGDEEVVCSCDNPVLSNASSPDGKYIFAGDSSSTVYCFDAAGERLWKLGLDCGSALSMQYHKERLYVVTTNGTLACIDASEAAIAAAQAGTLPETRQVATPRQVEAVATTAVESTSEVGAGVVVRCVAEGGKLRMRVESAGYDPSWNVQFPRNLREEGARYVVDEVKESGQGGFYRAHGNIRKLVEGSEPPATPARKRKPGKR